MPDSSHNGHSDAPPLRPVVRPPLGERAVRGLPETHSLHEAELETLAEPEIDPFQEAKLESFQEAEVDPFQEPELESLREAESEFTPSDEEIAALAPFADGDGGSVPPAPPLDLDGSSGGSGGDPDTPRDKELGLVEHLAELRVRLLWCFAAVGVGMVVTWNKCNEISEWILAPILHALKGKGTPISTDPTGFFTIYLQISMVSALIITMPFLLFQVWRFIEPALTNNERRYTLVLVPFASVLFFLGVGLGYWMSPMFFNFLLAFQLNGVLANWDYGLTVVFLAKTLLIFGLAFQVPVVTIFLNKTGIVSRNLLIHYWRHVVVVIFTVVAFVTPTWDPLTMTVCALPPCLLYLVSIWMVKWL
jgi:sec-independent protein translocase protein TatC